MNGLAKELYEEGINPSTLNGRNSNIIPLRLPNNIETNDSEIKPAAKTADDILYLDTLRKGVNPFIVRKYMGNSDKINVDYRNPLSVESLYMRDNNGKEQIYRIVTGMEGGSMNRETLEIDVNKACQVDSKENRKTKRDIINSIYTIKKLKKITQLLTNKQI
ncbi:MAG: hypothetical protein KAS04_05085 [Candidatus Aenigmarchaeota archaeon]|nr:hypothetical protein [Candidatus Aenigmarchaeota archaeon]